MSNPLAIASIVIYVILLQPSLYCLWKHGWPGSLGWGYLQVFCLLRIIGNAIELQSQTVSEKTLIVSNIGLSPLLLATAGILHEALVLPFPRNNGKVPIAGGNYRGLTFVQTQSSQSQPEEQGRMAPHYPVSHVRQHRAWSHSRWSRHFRRRKVRINS